MKYESATRVGILIYGLEMIDNNQPVNRAMLRALIKNIKEYGDWDASHRGHYNFPAMQIDGWFIEGLRLKGKYKT